MKNLFNLVKKFENSRNSNYIEDLKDKFVKNLYSTFVYFLPIKKIKYNLINHKDKRGSFAEFLKQKEMVNFQFLQQKTIKFEVIIFITQKLKIFLWFQGKQDFI